MNGKSVGVFRVDDQFYALRNRCPHQFGPLCAGELMPRALSDGPGDMRLDSGPPLLTCPWHGWEYDIATGQSFMGPGRGNLAVRSYDVNEQSGRQERVVRDYPRWRNGGFRSDAAVPTRRRCAARSTTG